MKYTELEAIVSYAIQSWAKYKKFRKGILIRDNYTCIECGLRKKSNHTHHIKSRENFPELCFDQSNVVTLCKSCHTKEENKNGFNNYIDGRSNRVCYICKTKISRMSKFGLCLKCAWNNRRKIKI